jgi:hypothetical protein
MHSHTDPGWIKTLNQYFEEETKFIFDNTLDAVTTASEIASSRLIPSRIPTISSFMQK